MYNSLRYSKTSIRLTRYGVLRQAYVWRKWCVNRLFWCWDIGNVICHQKQINSPKCSCVLVSFEKVSSFTMLHTTQVKRLYISHPSKLKLILRFLKNGCVYYLFFSVQLISLNRFEGFYRETLSKAIFRFILRFQKQSNNPRQQVLSVLAQQWFEQTFIYLTLVQTLCKN